MASELPSLSSSSGTSESWLRLSLRVAAFNTIVAAFLTLIEVAPFRICLIASQCVGLSTFATVKGVYDRWTNQSPPLWVVGIAIGVGASLGVFLAQLLTGIELATPSVVGQQLLLRTIAFALLFGVFGSYYFLSRERIAQATAAVQQEQLNIAALQREAAEARLKLLRARIEPHFLFNTLSNVLSLIEVDPQTSKRMLESFTLYLRAVLSDTREKTTTLRDELRVARAYLDVFKVRMGERLNVEIDLPNDLAELPFPSMLVQPLVENAVLHGLEPSVQGGTIRVTATRQDDVLRIVVEDDGVGLQNADGVGVGLTSVRNSLRSIYGERGSLRLDGTLGVPGVRAVVEIEGIE